jgi:thymidine kinase
MPAHLEVYTGPMFSAKTERLIAELKRATYAGKRILVIKPSRDTRTEDFIASRRMHPDGSTSITDRFPAVIVHSEAQLQQLIDEDGFDVLAIDEAQFFPLDEDKSDMLGWLGRAVRTLLRQEREESLRILVAGLDTDFAEEPFGPMPGLLALADTIEKLKAVCMVCGSYYAHLSQRLSVDEAQVSVGDAELYQARCRACFIPPK